jgi:vancomycin aglycone glucosyltransferase
VCGLVAFLGRARHFVRLALFDQHYWAKRVNELAIGTAHAPAAPTTDSLARALRQTLASDVADRARSICAQVRLDGTRVAAKGLMRGTAE